MERAPRPPFALQVDLPDLLPFTGEFGAEINSFLPFIYWLHQSGLMQGRRIRTYPGMQPFYFFLAPAQIEEWSMRRAYSFPVQRPDWLPNRDDHAARRSPFELFPDYRARFRDERLAGERPLLILHNKYSVEWNRAPVNFFPAPLLAELFATLASYRIVYLRPGIAAAPRGYCGDHQPDLAFDDHAVLRQFPDVTLFEDLAQQIFPGLSYNEAKLRLYASAHHHVTVQGGNAHLAALFSGSVIAIYHRFGQEIRQSYATGHFSRAANPAPMLLICRTAATLREACRVLQASQIADERVALPATAAALAASLSPSRQCGVDRMAPPPEPAAAAA